jgi:hypothetical protein
MVPTDIIRGRFFEDGGATVLARVIGQAGSNITQASLSTITYAIYAAETGTSVATGTVTISSSVYDTLQTSDARWTHDTTGYNFTHALTASNFASGDKRYRVEYKFTPVSGEVFWLVCELQALQVLTS